jgi:peptidyl-tRNA hydrolase, PTH1 family
MESFIAEEKNPVYIICGLGNPGREYRESRHNVGFRVIDLLAQDLNIRLTRMQSRAIVGTGMVSESKIVLAKPQTFMNLSGQAVASLVRFYKIPLNQLLVIHDDMDLPFETLRLRAGGGSAGQKGLASTIERLGTQDFPRLRIGIGHPSAKGATVGYVLEDFSNQEEQFLKNILERAVQAVRIFILEGIERAMNDFNGTIEKG